MINSEEIITTVDHPFYVKNQGFVKAGELIVGSARQKAESEAPRNSNGKMKCPTWGKEIPDKITINTKNGPVDRIGYDLDHYPETWAERKVKLQSLETTPTRTEVLDCYNSDLRVQCHECNIKHIFEGVKGDFAE